jgi:hypothetical protein
MAQLKVEKYDIVYNYKIKHLCHFDIIPTVILRRTQRKRRFIRKMTAGIVKPDGVI